jgi:membrane-associated phospholipid phosphatase
MRQILPTARFQRSMAFDGRGETRFLPGTIVCCVLLISFYVILVGTDWGHQLDDEAYLGRSALNPQVVKLDAALLSRISNATIMTAGGVLLLISIVRRRVLVGVLAIAGFFTAVIGAEILKDFVFPYRALIPDDARLGKDLLVNSYPSGHATVATAFVLALLMVSPARWRSWLAAVSGTISSIYAAGVLFAGWHRASDALGALAWSAVCMNLAAAAAVRLKGQPATGKSRHAWSASILLGLVMLLSFFLIAGAAAPQYHHDDLPFFFLSALIILGSFTLATWYGRELRAVEFRKGARASEVRGER